jgi:hypothetical protein
VDSSFRQDVIKKGIKKMAKPTDNSEIFLDQLIASIQTHLPTIKGIYLTTSLYPPLMTPGPGVVPFVGYSVPPASKPTPPPSDID